MHSGATSGLVFQCNGTTVLALEVNSVLFMLRCLRKQWSHCENRKGGWSIV